MMAAGAAHGDGPDHHKLVEPLDVGKLGHRRRLEIAASKDFGQVHLGDAAGRILGVMIVLDVDDQALEHRLHLFGDFVEQGVDLAGLDKRGYVVVGVEPVARPLDPRPDPP